LVLGSEHRRREKKKGNKGYVTESRGKKRGGKRKGGITTG